MTGTPTSKLQGKASRDRFKPQLRQVIRGNLRFLLVVPVFLLLGFFLFGTVAPLKKAIVEGRISYLASQTNRILIEKTLSPKVIEVTDPPRVTEFFRTIDIRDIPQTILFNTGPMFGGIPNFTITLFRKSEKLAELLVFLADDKATIGSFNSRALLFSSVINGPEISASSAISLGSYLSGF